MTKVPPRKWEELFYPNYLEIDGNSAARPQSSRRGGHWDTKGNLVYCDYIVPDKILNQAITLAKRFSDRLDK